MPLSAVIDTNVLVAGISTDNPRSANAAVIDHLFAGRFVHCALLASLIEVHEVLRSPTVRALHKLTDQKIDLLFAALEAKSMPIQPGEIVAASLPRDQTDTKWLALAGSTAADYLVTNDRRHLLRLKKFRQTAIVTPAAFLRELGRGSMS